MAEDRNGEVPKGSLFQKKENLVPDILNIYQQIMLYKAYYIGCGSGQGCEFGK